MFALDDHERRGRPDITHFTLLEALGSPLNHARRLRVLVHTQQEWLIGIAPETRLPRQGERFDGLINKLFIEGALATPKGFDTPLLTLQRDITLQRVLDEARIETVIGFGAAGEHIALDTLFGAQADTAIAPFGGRTALVVGAFPAGEFSAATKALFDQYHSIYQKPLEAWTVTARLLGALERQLALI